MNQDNLIKFLDGIYPLSEALKAHLHYILKSKEFSKKDYLLKDGQVSKNVYFIRTGLVKAYYIKDGNEICSWFMKEGDVIFSVESFYSQTPGYEYIQCIEKCSVYYISYDELQFIYKNFLEFNYVGRVLTEQYYAFSEKRLRSLRMQTAMERYLFLKENHTDLINRVPNRYLASYLGVREETLSREKKK